MKTNQIDPFEEACEALNINPLDLPIVDMLPEKDRKSIIAYYKLIIIIRYKNAGWEPDFNNWSQKKWLLWLFGGNANDGSLCGLSAAGAYNGFSDASPDFGARLLFKSEKLALDSWDQCKELWLDYILINAPEQ